MNKIFEILYLLKFQLEVWSGLIIKVESLLQYNKGFLIFEFFKWKVWRSLVIKAQAKNY